MRAYSDVNFICYVQIKALLREIVLQALATMNYKSGEIIFLASPTLILLSIVVLEELYQMASKYLPVNL